MNNFWIFIKNNYLLFLILVSTNFTYPLFGQNNLGGFKFIENTGQWESEVKFRADLGAGYLYIENNGLLFDLYDAKKVNENLSGHFSENQRIFHSVINWHAYRVSFVGAKFDKVLPKRIAPEYYNFYLGQNRKKWTSKNKACHELLLEDIYDGIDLNIYSKYFNLKYDLIVSPKANPDQIKIDYNGADSIKIIKGKIHIYTSVNHIIEDKPYAYQVINDRRKVVDCKYVINGNQISFKLEQYDNNLPLIIDPVLMFASYSGSYSNNFGYSATSDSKGFLYSGSSAFGPNYPTTLGAYDETWNGGSVDIALSKFDTTGTFLVYSTFIGGSDTELPHSLIVNQNDELLVFGTTSSLNYPFTINCIDSTFNGGTYMNLSNGLGVIYNNGSDIVVSHFSEDGSQLLSSTYLGGSANDGINFTSTIASENILRYNYADEVRGEIDVDEFNNVYIATCTRSNDLPMNGNGFQSTYGGGNLDGCIFKLAPDLDSIVWSSYFGGKDHDAIYSLALDNQQNIYVVGGSNSSDLPTTILAYDTSFNAGRSDGFITFISENGQNIIQSTYWGSNTYDQIYFVELDNLGDVFVLGQTEIQDSTFVKNVIWSNFGSGQFISKFNPNLDSLIYSTVFGSGNGISISPTAFLVDLCNSVYLAGWGGAVNNIGILNNNAGYTNNLPVTPDAFQSTTDGSDFYIFVMADDASQQVYGSFFGSPTAAEHVDGGTSRFDKKGKIYQAICAGCGNDSNMPTYPSNPVSASNNSSCNLGVFKMDFLLPAVIADFSFPPTLCINDTVHFTNTSLTQNFTQYFWDFGDGNTSSQASPSHFYGNPGLYQIKLRVQDTASCNFGDSIVKFLKIINDSTFYQEAANICMGDPVNIGVPAQSNFTYSWISGANINDTSNSSTWAIPVIDEDYILLINNGICIDTLIQPVNSIGLQLNVSSDTIICLDSNAIDLVANSYGTSQNFIWSSTPFFVDTLNSTTSDSIVSILPLLTSTYYIKITELGCELTDEVTITIENSSFYLSDSIAFCGNQNKVLSITLINPPDTVWYDWSPDIYLASPDSLHQVTLNITQDQIINVHITTSTGCEMDKAIMVKLDTFPNISFTALAQPDTIFPYEVSYLSVSPDNNYQFEWIPQQNLDNPNVATPIFSGDHSQTYLVTTETDLCTRTDTVFIYVHEMACGPSDVFIPNAFTPNGDGNNDVLYVRGNFIEKMIFRVFNRWGELVFESTSPAYGWDGRFNDKDCDPAVFDYYLDMICIGGESYFQKGNVTLIR